MYVSILGLPLISLGKGLSLNIFFPLYLFPVLDESYISVPTRKVLREVPTNRRMKFPSRTEKSE